MCLYAINTNFSSFFLTNLLNKYDIFVLNAVHILIFCSLYNFKGISITRILLSFYWLQNLRLITFMFCFGLAFKAICLSSICNQDTFHLVLVSDALYQFSTTVLLRRVIMEKKFRLLSRKEISNFKIRLK